MTALDQANREDAIVADIPLPVLFNPWKHHTGFLRDRIRAATSAGLPGVEQFARELVVVGTKLMDLYTGEFTPAEVAARVVADLRATGTLEPRAFRALVEVAGGYAVVPLADGSQWVLRYAEENRYVHLHPGRHVPRTLRVRANVLKTAAVTLAYAGCVAGDPLDLALLNEVRRRYLALSPVGCLRDGDQGIEQVVELLQGKA